ncbi:uncharacterized methyltransferase YdaC-like [Watersipora subatra]|uniref:uncharacterized methyltransferase YdaC-like n=1 Tax=Watersipora subatra TaxID=2589382 RepID=UPI00355BE035
MSFRCFRLLIHILREMGVASDILNWCVFRIFMLLVPLCMYARKIWPFSVLHKSISKNLGRPDNGTLMSLLIKQFLEVGNEAAETLAVDKCEIQSSDKVLEVGFGPGLGIQKAASLIDKSCGGHVSGVDYSESMVSAATERLTQEIHDGLVDLQHGSVADLPYDSNSFDKIFHCNVFYFWDDCVGCCSELLRVLKPGGLMLTTLNPNAVANAVSFDILNKQNANIPNYLAALKQAGFVNVVVVDQHRGGAVHVCIYAWARKD